MEQDIVSIPFNKPYIAGRETHLVAKAIIENMHISGNGPFTRLVQSEICRRFDCKKALLTHSCTAALEMAAILCDIHERDEIVMPSFTFVSTANAFVLFGAKPVFVDIDADTLNVDVSRIEQAITGRTKAIVPVHYAGVGCEMEAVNDIAERNGLVVIEDAAQGVNAKYKNQFLGTIGDIGAYSFHETKNFICGEGGALLLNDEKYFDRAEVVRERGTDRARFFKGKVDTYTWVDVGSSYLMPDLLAAFLYGQFEKFDMINQRRKAIWDLYARELVPLANEGKLRLPYVPHYCSSNSHLFYIILPDQQTRDGLMEFLRSRNVHSVFHYLPLHTSPFGQRFGYRPGDLPVTEHVSKCLLRLPFYYELAEGDQVRVTGLIRSFFDRRRR